MKTIYPKHIKKGILAGMTFNIGPMNVSIIQLVVLAVGAALSLVIFNSMAKDGSKALGILLAIIIMGFFVIVAFFKISELGLLAFVSKLIRNSFFDVRKKSQTNYQRQDKTEIAIKEAQAAMSKGTKTITSKTRKIDPKLLENIEEQGL